MMVATYVLVREYLPFSDEAVQAQYTQFGFTGGFLCHSERWSRFHIVELTDITCHFAKTTIQNRDVNLMHVLPLNKVWISFHKYNHWLTALKMIESYTLPSVVV